MQFFFQIEQSQQSFALYTEATKFIRHRDGMVRRRPCSPRHGGCLCTLSGQGSCICREDILYKQASLHCLTRLVSQLLEPSIPAHTRWSVGPRDMPPPHVDPLHAPGQWQVRAAVRSLTLNVYGIDDGAVQEFVCSPPASSYFTELAIGMTEQCQARPRAIPGGHSVGEMQCTLPSFP